MTGNAHRVKVYDVSGPPPHPPLRDVAFDLPGATTPPLPAEVSVCLSYRGAITGGMPANRRRGRIYVGPLDTGAVSTSVTPGDVKPDFGLRGALRDAGVRLMTPSSPRWSVWSRTGGVFVPVEHVWVDDAFDTQHRRGGKPTERISADRPAT